MLGLFLVVVMVIFSLVCISLYCWDLGSVGSVGSVADNRSTFESTGSTQAQKTILDLSNAKGRD